MITLVGGKYDGRTLDRDPIPAGQTLAIIDNGDHEVYRMHRSGKPIAIVDDPYGKMHTAVSATALDG